VGKSSDHRHLIRSCWLDRLTVCDINFLLFVHTLEFYCYFIISSCDSGRREGADSVELELKFAEVVLRSSGIMPRDSLFHFRYFTRRAA